MTNLSQQSVGTWFGFDSRIVCRSVKDPSKRSIFVPLGDIKAHKRGDHVQVWIVAPKTPEVRYTRFTVNSTLGRIDCAAEPAMVYRKAQIHALTNGPVADTLTGRTGAEEALSILSSGICQPWQPLNPMSMFILQSISKLSPERKYYPEEMRIMSTESWDLYLPCNSQREEYSIIVEQILKQSARLAEFHPSASQPANPANCHPSVKKLPMAPSAGDSHLNLRALLRRQLHRRHSPGGLEIPQVPDVEYRTRDRPSTSGMKYANVFAITSLIRERPASISTVTDLAFQLSQSLSIKGYSQPLDKVTLSDRLNLDVRQYWGPLIQTLRNIPNQYSAMFFLAVISFRTDASMPLVRTLVAIFLYSELRSVELPTAAEYNSFQPGQVPRLEVLTKLIDSFKISPPKVSRT